MQPPPSHWLVAVGVTLMLCLVGCDVSDQSSTTQPGAGKQRATNGSSGSDPRPRWKVVRVVDGDTIEVRRGHRSLTVRLIGIDTPETVHPSQPVQCHGPQASAFATQQLLERRVRLEYDRSQGRTDHYDRTLAYVWVGASPSVLFNRLAIRRGHAMEYTYGDPYRWRDSFLAAQAMAQQRELGVWRCPRPGS